MIEKLIFNIEQDHSYLTESYFEEIQFNRTSNLEVLKKTKFWISKLRKWKVVLHMFALDWWKQLVWTNQQYV